VRTNVGPGRRVSPAYSATLYFSRVLHPQHLAEKILTSRAALEGERKQVTVLFADMKGSMELLADRDPEEARKLLDRVLERMMEAVHHYEGTVNQVGAKRAWFRILKSVSFPSGSSVNCRAANVVRMTS
jgi:class 3 adenylate cyclase